ncbi:Hcp family type VI secretion system effector [Motilimonas pumila]|uniref:Hcp family type VI secretion system effector n=1 Tax=Motilimonas pumila TaxID=2303987 RepID=A0A418Y965_9GAMM|nr:Hcp family type VI secretion system effector [Motilimonas pumila]RJG36432.1 Hcp family type VI secretion system effector [Motilimonas pumila]
MPTPCYIAIEGQTQGNITAGAFTAESVGNIYQEGHEDEMLVQEFDHIVTVPTDPQSGQPSGQRVHKPFKFTVALNKAVPLLYNALASGEMLPRVELRWYHTTVEGKQEHFFSTILTDATIVDVDCKMPHCQDETKGGFTQLVKVSLAYRKIDWEHLVAGTSGADDWRAPLEA